MVNTLNKNPLVDNEFLKDLFSKNEREIYARITLLNISEEPIERLEGIITEGSINIDGTSAVRRTCSLTVIPEEININEFYWGLKSKFQLEVGLKNNINFSYPNIIWFKQGIFALTQFNISQTTNKWTVKIQGKDKMCFLNGDLSGHLPSVDFAREQYTDLATGEITFIDLPIKTIIKKLLQEFALELPHNIIINDIDEAGRELLEYRGVKEFYLLKDVNNEDFQMTIDETLSCYYRLRDMLTYEEYIKIPEEYSYLRDIYIKGENNYYYFNQDIADTIEEYQKNIYQDNNEIWFKGIISHSFNIIYDNLLDNDEFIGDKEPTIIRLVAENKPSNEPYYISCLKCGDTPGYRMTDLVYGGELKSNIGETITSVLDKIKNKFTNFEYYYDVDGKFIFQKKKEYLTTPWDFDKIENAGLPISINNDNSEILFNFINGQAVSSYQSTPKIQDIKNDYSVHGTRDNTVFHMRYAIDEKPHEYTPIRPLKEKIVTVIWDKINNRLIRESETVKYYDAPEEEPYNHNGLISTDDSDKLITIFSKNNFNNIFSKDEITTINSINFENIDKDQLDAWSKNFNFETEEDITYLQWSGTIEDIKKMVQALNEVNTFYGNPVLMSCILAEKEDTETWIIKYPYFAAYPYATSDIIENNNIIHHKVDWRELIYQMSLDYRKMGSTDDYLYYLRQANPQFNQDKTGYEQYYIDMSLWRDLYNPNPKLLFTNEIDFQTVKNQIDLVNNDNNSNLIYIKNGYHPITTNDIENLRYSDIYQYSSPEDNEIKSIYPGITSEACHLITDNCYYVQDKNGQFKELKPQITEEGIKNQDYLELAKMSMQQIYIKDAESEPLSYKLYIEEKLQTKNLIKNNFYIKDKNYIQLNNKDNNLWNLYYCSTLYPLAHETTNILINLENLVKNYEQYKTNSVDYISNFNALLKSYIEYLNKTSYDDIKSILLEITNLSMDNYENLIQDTIILLKQVKNLPNILTLKIKEDSSVKENIDKINKLLLFNFNNKTKALLNDLYINFNKASTVEQQQIIQANFHNESKDFQQYIVLQDIDNFNKLNSDKLIQIPIKYYKASYAYNHDIIDGNFWSLDIYENPQLLTFWFDFLDPLQSELAKYAVSAIGTRSKVINDKDVKAIHYKTVPSIIFKSSEQKDFDNLSGYTYINLTPAFANLFAVSSKGKTAKERIEELLYIHSYCAENINISTIPIYGLEPNYKIQVQDDKCNINGKYIINKITIPLDYKKMMSITATKAVPDII